MVNAAVRGLVEVGLEASLLREIHQESLETHTQSHHITVCCYNEVENARCNITNQQTGGESLTLLETKRVLSLMELVRSLL